MENTKPENRVPLALIRSGNELKCQWINTFDKRFTEPFFFNSVRRLQFPNYQKKSERDVTGLYDMQQQARAIEAINPSIIIFHLSRCGSTLISQLFAASGRFIVLSEVPFFDELLRLPFSDGGVDKTSIPVLLSSALKFYGRKKNDAEEHLIIKTDCWHIFFYDTLRALFPSLPFVLMYRSPNEVLSSLAKIPGRQVSPHEIQPEIFGLPGIPEQYNREIYTATVIEKILAKFLEVAETDDRTLLVNYNEGAINVLKKIASFANLSLTGDEIGAMEKRTQFHSKNPGELFVREPSAAVPESLNEAMRLYAALEKKRKML